MNYSKFPPSFEAAAFGDFFRDLISQVRLLNTILEHCVVPENFLETLWLTHFHKHKGVIYFYSESYILVRVYKKTTTPQKNTQQEDTSLKEGPGTFTGRAWSEHLYDKP